MILVINNVKCLDSKQLESSFVKARVKYILTIQFSYKSPRLFSSGARHAGINLPVYLIQLSNEKKTGAKEILLSSLMEKV